MASPEELDAMRRAITIAAFSLGNIGGMPPAGCVILDPHSRIAGEGYQEEDDGSSAESNALNAAGRQARGGTAVLTLEPSMEPGQENGWCQKFVDAGIRRIITALPNPSLDTPGEAVTALRLVGLDVETDVLRDEAWLVFGSWRRSVDANRPLVTWPYIYESSGALVALERSINPQCITEMSRLRLVTDAILYTDGRIERGIPRSPYDKLSKASYAQVLHLRPLQTLNALYTSGVHSLVLSGGLELAKPFLASSLVDEALVYLAIDGASHSPDASKGIPSSRFLPPGFRLTEITRIGRYVRSRGHRQEAACPQGMVVPS